MKHYLSKIALMALVGVGIATAAQWDKKTIITTEEVMQVPGTTLQPGTYVIRLADSDSNRHIVQFFDKDEKHIITTVLAIPNERVRPTGKTVFAFWEVPAGQPKALRAWFYPGDNFGQEFAYPKLEADRIAASNNNAAVPIAESTEKTKTEVATVTPAEPVAVEPAPAPPPPAAEPAPAPVEIAAAPQEPPAVTSVQVAPPAPATVYRDDTPKIATAERLPKTASNAPVYGLIGLLAIAGALVLKARYSLGWF
jgi:LPXTG-motif cell wall-anchored protein